MPCQFAMHLALAVAFYNARFLSNRRALVRNCGEKSLSSPLNLFAFRLPARPIRPPVQQREQIAGVVFFAEQRLIVVIHNAERLFKVLREQVKGHIHQRPPPLSVPHSYPLRISSETRPQVGWDGGVGCSGWGRG